MFEKDLYHSPRVVWGREVNLFLLGTADQISAALDSAGHATDPSLEPYVRSLRSSLERVLSAVTASHLQHNEVWSYRISDGRSAAHPLRHELGRAAVEHDGSRRAVRAFTPWNAVDTPRSYLPTETRRYISTPWPVSRVCRSSR